jgi:hypothetical protein
MAGAAVVLLGVFWFVSRYPQLFNKAEHLRQALPSMAYSSQVMTVETSAPVWLRILGAAVNWLDSMKIGMTFGVLLGALLHTVLRYYPLKIGKNLYLNSLKGALVGVPGGVCANCAVPVACGVTRGNGRIEVALGFLFSSPNFNPVVVTMTFMAFPLVMGLTKYAILLFVALNITGRQSETNAYGVENIFLRSIGQPQRNITDTLAHPPYSDNPNIDKPLFIDVGKPHQ